MSGATHLVILREPYLERILRGEKTIESRWLRVRAAPYGRVAPGDRLLLKRASGPLMGEARAERVAHYDDLTPERVDSLLAMHAEGLRLDGGFVERARGARYVVLIWLGAVRRYERPLRLARRDRRGWIAGYTAGE